jgi:iron(III) transport system substrate-binding protein
MALTRRQLAASLGAAATGVFLPRGARADLATLEAAARKEGSLTWYVAQMSGPAAEAMGKRFSQRYPGISVSVIRTTGQVAYERLTQELKNSAPHCDVFSSTDIAHYPTLRARGALARYEPESAGEVAPAYQGLGEKGYFYPTTGSLQIMVYHTTSVKPDDWPKRWTDLLEPKFRSRVGTGHPAFSGYFGQWVLAMRKMYGWEYFEKLSRNRPRIGRSGNDPITLINAGECLVGTGPVSTALQTASKGNPIGFVYPEEGSLLCIGPSAVLAAAPHPNAGRLFLEWLHSLDYAEACAEWFLEPVRADAPPMQGAKPMKDVRTINMTAAEIAKELPIAIEQWRDTFGN